MRRDHTNRGVAAGRPLFGDSEPYHELFFYGAVFAIGFLPLAKAT